MGLGCWEWVGDALCTSDVLDEVGDRGGCEPCEGVREAGDRGGCEGGGR